MILCALKTGFNNNILTTLVCYCIATLAVMMMPHPNPVKATQCATPQTKWTDKECFADAPIFWNFPVFVRGHFVRGPKQKRFTRMLSFCKVPPPSFEAWAMRIQRCELTKLNSISRHVTECTAQISQYVHYPFINLSISKNVFQTLICR